MEPAAQRIVITGGAGLVGQNLVLLLREQGCSNLCVLDRSAHNLRILTQLNPGIDVVEADLSQPGLWEDAVASADVLVLLHAQIGGLLAEAFERNNVCATVAVLAANPRCHIVHVSSSAVNSRCHDWYARTKRTQEDLVLAAPNPSCILRPTLMFGWFDRKHLGWLSRFMRRSPIFPVPGDGLFLRQPLYARDFCRIILRCIERQESGAQWNVSGRDKITYIELVRAMRRAVSSRTPILRIPVSLFRVLLKLYSRLNPDPPFTAQQLDALVIDELFEDWDWESHFGLRATPLSDALRETFSHPVNSAVELRF